MAFDVANGVTGAINGIPVDAPKTPAKPVKKETTNDEGAE